MSEACICVKTCAQGVQMVGAHGNLSELRRLLVAHEIVKVVFNWPLVIKVASWSSKIIEVRGFIKVAICQEALVVWTEAPTPNMEASDNAPVSTGTVMLRSCLKLLDQRIRSWNDTMR